jgi:murein L,D-transpeptidase YcbB/YkuD
VRPRLALATLTALVAAGSAQAGNPQIAGLQVALRAKGAYSGAINAVAGRGTVQALRRFQRRSGLKADGLAGVKTRLALGKLGRPLYGRRVLRRGLVGWDVAVLQFLLARRGRSPGAIDGQFGPKTETALRSFQRARGKRSTGVGGASTLSALCSSSACLIEAAPDRSVRYVVREGDNLTELAQRHRTTIGAIARLNHLDPREFLIIGTRLRIPVSS